MRKLPDNVSISHRDLYFELKRVYPFHDIRPEYSVERFLRRFYKKNKIDTIYQDVKLLSTISRLHFDIFDLTANIVFEVQGDQHYHFVKHFHGKINKFERQQMNDKRKVQACEIAETKMIIIDTDTQISEELIRSYYEE